MNTQNSNGIEGVYIAASIRPEILCELKDFYAIDPMDCSCSHDCDCYADADPIEGISGIARYGIYYSIVDRGDVETVIVQRSPRLSDDGSFSLPKNWLK